MSVVVRRLHCRVDRLKYHFDSRTGQIWLPATDCCDMSECVRLFRRIDRRVRLIETFQGLQPDTRYERDEDGQWVAIDKHGTRYERCEIP